MKVEILQRFDLFGLFFLMFDPQTILSCKPEGDAKLTELRRQSQSLSEQEDQQDGVKQEAERTVTESEEQWRTVLESAEDSLKRAEVQYSLSRGLEVFRSQVWSTNTWVKELQQQAESRGSGTLGSRAQIEDRLSTAQVEQTTPLLSLESQVDRVLTFYRL